MFILNKVCRVIERVNEWSGRLISWLIIILMLIVSFEVMMRYVFNAPTKWVFDTSYMLLASFLAVGFAYVMLHRGHIRVDLLYNRFPPRTRLIIDSVLNLIIFLPLFTLITIEIVEEVNYAFTSGEKSTITTWYPLVWPYKACVAYGIVLLLIQGFLNFAKDLITLCKGGYNP